MDEYVTTQEGWGSAVRWGGGGADLAQQALKPLPHQPGKVLSAGLIRVGGLSEGDSLRLQLLSLLLFLQLIACKKGERARWSDSAAAVGKGLLPPAQTSLSIAYALPLDAPPPHSHTHKPLSHLPPSSLIASKHKPISLSISSPPSCSAATCMACSQSLSARACCLSRRLPCARR